METTRERSSPRAGTGTRTRRASAPRRGGGPRRLALLLVACVGCADAPRDTAPDGDGKPEDSGDDGYTGDCPLAAGAWSASLEATNDDCSVADRYDGPWDGVVSCTAEDAFVFSSVDAPWEDVLAFALGGRDAYVAQLPTRGDYVWRFQLQPATESAEGTWSWRPDGVDGCASGGPLVLTPG